MRLTAPCVVLVALVTTFAIRVFAQQPEVAALLAFSEGPAADRDGNVYFSEMVSQRIMRLSPSGVLTVFRDNSNYANGLVIDGNNRLIAAEGATITRTGMPVSAKPRVTRTDLRTGAVEVLADGYDGKPLGAPNDVTVDDAGRIYFSDSAGSAVYRIDSPGRVVRLLGAPDVRSPGGVQVSPDNRTLYVGDYNDLTRVVRAYDLLPDGSVTHMRVLYDFRVGRGPDGICIDTQGNLYVAAGFNTPQTGPRATHATAETKAGIYVLSPTGALLRSIPIPEDNVTNCAFGGPDMKTLYVTAGKTVFSIRNEIAGLPR